MSEVQRHIHAEARGRCEWHAAHRRKTTHLLVALRESRTPAHDGRDHCPTPTTNERRPALKTCSRCGQSKPLGEFHRDSRKRDGRRSECKTCVSAHWREYMRRHNRRPEVQERKRQHNRRIRALVLEAKGDRCADCGGRFLPHELHFHHRDPATKSFTIGSASGGKKSPAALAAEIAKCVVVCQPCHVRRHRRS